MRGYARVASGIAWVLLAAAVMAGGDATKEQAIKKDRAQYEGTWQVVSLERDGTKTPADDARKITVINHADTWIIKAEGKEVSRGTSKIDPTKKPKTIDFTPLNGSDQGKVFLGIYAIEGNSRKLCFAQPGKPRPTEFTSKPGKDHCLVVFERLKK